MSRITSRRRNLKSLQKTPQLPKFYFFFKPDGLVLAKDQIGKVVNETIPYKMIKCINVLGKSSFYFKSNKAGYVLLFKNFDIKNAQIWFENLILLMDKDMEAKEEIKMVEVTDNFSMLNLASESCDFQFNLKAAMEKVAELRRASEVRNTRTSLVSVEVNQEKV